MRDVYRMGGIWVGGWYIIAGFPLGVQMVMVEFLTSYTRLVSHCIFTVLFI